MDLCIDIEHSGIAYGLVVVSANVSARSASGMLADGAEPWYEQTLTLSPKPPGESTLL